MAGLLDYQMPAQTAMDDPRMVGMLKLATGLLQAGGTSARQVGFGQALGAAGGEAMGAYQAQKQLAQKDAMEKIQMQAALMKLQKETELQDMFAKMFKGESPASGGKVFGVLDENGRQVGPGVGGPVPQGMQQAPQQSGLPGGIDPRAAGFAGLTGATKELAGEMLKKSMPNMQIHNGVAVDMNRVSPGFQPGLQVSNNGQATQIEIGPDGKPVISAPKGAVDTFSGYQAAENQFKPPFEMKTPSNATIQLFPTEIPAFQKGVMPGRLLPNDARTAMAKDGASGVVSGDFKTPQGRLNGQFDISQLGPIGVGPTTEQTNLRETTSKGQQDFNSNWIKSTYQPVQDAGAAASNTLSQVQSFRNLDFNSGWGSEAKATGAAILEGLGVAPKNAEMFATQAQRFQQVAMDKLWSSLNAAKGMQTEGDATRAKQTFVSLKNTPAANQYIADLYEAMAKRDQMKAAFYQDAYQLAQKEGNYGKVDQKWREIQSSIWDDPIMQKWVKK